MRLQQHPPAPRAAVGGGRGQQAGRFGTLRSLLMLLVEDWLTAPALGDTGCTDGASTEAAAIHRHVAATAPTTGPPVLAKAAGKLGPHPPPPPLPSHSNGSRLRTTSASGASLGPSQSDTSGLDEMIEVQSTPTTAEVVQTFNLARSAAPSSTSTSKMLSTRLTAGSGMHNSTSEPTVGSEWAAEWAADVAGEVERRSGSGGGPSSSDALVTWSRSPETGPTASGDRRHLLDGAAAPPDLPGFLLKEQPAPPPQPPHLSQRSPKWLQPPRRQPEPPSARQHQQPQQQQQQQQQQSASGGRLRETVAAQPEPARSLEHQAAQPAVALPSASSLTLSASPAASAATESVSELAPSMPRNDSWQPASESISETEASLPRNDSWQRTCAECAGYMNGTVFMLHDHAYCSADCRLNACRRDAHNGSGSGVRIGLSKPMSRSPSFASVASSNSSTGLYASFRPWV